MDLRSTTGPTGRVPSSTTSANTQGLRQASDEESASSGSRESTKSNDEFPRCQKMGNIIYLNESLILSLFNPVSIFFCFSAFFKSVGHVSPAI